MRSASEIALLAPREAARGERRALRREEPTAVELARPPIARGLSAPAPPVEGDLRPNGTGWLVGVDPVGRGPHPRLLLAVACCAGGGALVALWFDLLAWQRPPLIVTMLLGALAPLALIGLFELAVRWALERHYARALRPRSLDDVAPGAFVCVTGVVSPRASVPTLFRGVPAVLFRDCMGSADEVRGIDFDLALDDGQQARVCVRRAFLVDRPTRAQEAPACGPVYAEPCAEGFSARLRAALAGESSLRTLGARHESSVGPGDRVEVTGVLHHELAPDAADPFARLVPTRLVLRAGRRGPLLVRRVPASVSRGRGWP